MRTGLGRGSPPHPEQARLGVRPLLVPTVGHGGQPAMAEPGRTAAHRHQLLRGQGPSGTAAGRNCSAAGLAPRLPCPGSPGSLALARVPPAAPGAGEPGRKAAHGGASAGAAAPAERDQPCLTGALTGKAFPLRADSPSQHRHSSVPQSQPPAAASLRAGLPRLSSPPHRLAPPQPPRPPLCRDGAQGAAVPPRLPCCARPRSGSFPLPAAPECRGTRFVPCPHGAIPNGACGALGMSMPARGCT